MAGVFYGFPLVPPSFQLWVLGGLIAFVMVTKALAETAGLYLLLFVREKNHEREERFWLRLTGFAVALGVGFCLGYVSFRVAPSSGEKVSFTSLLEGTSIVRMEGDLAGDIRKTSSGNWMVPMRVRWVWNCRGVGSAARGTVQLLVPKDKWESRKPLWGHPISVEGQWKTSGVFFMVRSWTLSVSSPLGKQGKTGTGCNGLYGPLIRNLSSFRASIRTWITERLVAFSWGPLALALLLGDRNELDSTVSRAFREAGCAPLLALSGMHLAVFSWLFLWGGERLVGKKAALVLSTFLLWCYLYLVGSSPSLLRAVLMVSLSSLCKFRGIPMDILNVLAASFMMHLLWVPSDGRSVAFMLSYLALLGLLVLAPRWNHLMRPLIPSFLLNALTASIGAFLATAPLVLVFFGILYPGGIMISPIVGLLVVVFMVGSLGFLLMLVLFPFLAPLFQRVLEILYTLILGILKMGTYFPSFTVTSWKIESAGLLLLVTLAISLLLVYGEKRELKRGISGAFDHI